MKRVAFLFTLIILSSFAESTLPECNIGDTKAKLRQERRAQRLRESGGIVEKKVDGPKALIINAQSEVPMSDIESAVKSIRQLVQIEIEAQSGNPGRTYKPTKDHPAVVTIINNLGNDTTILVAPEQNWAILNVALLIADKPTHKTLSDRIHKEIWRATAMTLGASNSMTQPCLLRQINTLHELDHTKNMVPSPEPISNMIDVSDKLGISRVHRASYRRACEEGWAPAPTNDVQKAIWDKVHALPTAPIKIKPETKKVTE